MILESYDGWFAATREHIERMSRNELQKYLELRGFAVYDDEPTELLRATALDDFDSESQYQLG